MHVLYILGGKSFASIDRVLVGVLMEYFHKGFAMLRHWYSNPNFHFWDNLPKP